MSNLRLVIVCKSCNASLPLWKDFGCGDNGRVLSTEAELDHFFTSHRNLCDPNFKLEVEN